MRIKRFDCALLSILVIASIVTLSTSLLSPSPVHAVSRQHAPIYINGNSGFTSPNPVNGGGSGTQNNPYIIENWAINASSAHGIWIDNTTKYFVIRDCLIENGGGSHSGIHLSNVINGRIENNRCLHNNIGIYLFSSSFNILSHNTCSNSLDSGISIYSSSNNNVLDNNICFNNSSCNIHLWNASCDNLTNNICYNTYGRSSALASWNGIAIYYSDYSIISNNICENSSHAGIKLSESYYVNVSNNITDNNYNGIYVDETNNCYNLLFNNTCINGKYGITLDSSSDNYNTLDSNTCEYNSYSGIFLDFPCSNNTILNNTCSNNLYGIYLTTSNNNTITLNYLLNNTTNNAYDDGINYWYNGYPSGGNYWSDYTGEDNYRGENQDQLGSDGIGDTPHIIPGGSNRDRYPLMSSFTPVWGGTATFRLENLNMIGLVNALQLNTGSKLVVKFYAYSTTFENEVVIETITPPYPYSIAENENVSHPLQGSLPVKTAVKKAELVLTTDNTENVISTIASFTVHQGDHRGRYMAILRAWSGSPSLQSAFRTEVLDILRQWSSAPP